MDKRIKNILRCYAAGMGIKETASTFHTSRNTVRKYVRLFLSSGKSIEQLLSLSDGQLDELFGCTASRHREPSSRRIELEALLPGYVSRLSRKGMSVRKLFKEYHAEYPDGYLVVFLQTGCPSVQVSRQGRRSCRALCRRPDVY